jgi:hypothetical protein
VNPDRRFALARERDRLIATVRALDGFEDFLRPPPPADLLAAGDLGPVVAVNVSRWRCDALVVTGGAVRTVPLDALTLDDIARHAERFLRAAGPPDDQPPGDPADPGRALDETLAWLWDVIAEPVLDALGIGPHTPGTAWPRLWWCPTSLLALLPLHAAGHHRRPGRSVIDRVVSSYVPTVRALLDARAARPPGPPGRLLVVTMPETAGQPALPGARRERDLLERLVPAERRTVLEGHRADRATVLAALTGHRWAHFSCHGDQDLARPAAGGLLLGDGRLTVADIAARRHHGEFAFLSACRTAVGGHTLADEAITLAAALHYTGYRHVIATLWPVSEQAALRAVRGVYGRLAATGEITAADSAVTLHAVTRELRDRAAGHPAYWAPFVHLGP